MRASLKKRDFLSKLGKGKKLSNPGRTQRQREIKTRMGSEIETKGMEKTKKGRATQIKQMFIIEVVIDNLWEPSVVCLLGKIPLGLFEHHYSPELLNCLYYLGQISSIFQNGSS